MTPGEIRASLLAQMDAAPPPTGFASEVWVEPAEPEHRTRSAAKAWQNRRSVRLWAAMDALEGIAYITLQIGRAHV